MTFILLSFQHFANALLKKKKKNTSEFFPAVFFPAQVLLFRQSQSFKQVLVHYNPILSQITFHFHLNRFAQIYA